MPCVKLLTVDGQTVGWLTNDRLRIRRQGVFTIDLARTAIHGRGARPEINVVFAALPVSRWHPRQLSRVISNSAEIGGTGLKAVGLLHWSHESSNLAYFFRYGTYMISQVVNSPGALANVKGSL